MIEARTIPELFQARIKATPDGVAYRQFDPDRGAWRDLTWSEIGRAEQEWRRALAGEGLVAGDRIALWLPNSADWVAAEQAATALGLIVVPLFLADAPATSAHLVRHSGARLLVVDTPTRWARLALSGPFDDLQRVIVVGGCEEKGISTPLASWLARTCEEPLPAIVSSDPDAVTTIIYTSGTTGRPKGAMLTHANLIGVARSILDLHPGSDEDVFLSYLPIAHVFERVVGYYVPMLLGARTVFVRSLGHLIEDLKTAGPTILLVVPSLMERIRASTIKASEKSRWRARLLEQAVAAGHELYEARRRGRAPSLRARLAWRALGRPVADRIKAGLGGRVRLMVCGGAPLPAETAQFFVDLGFPLVEGYGLTEASSAAVAPGMDAYAPGSVGRPLKGCDVRLGDRDEIQIRSPGVMRGYWHDDEATANAFSDGWLRTGDRGVIENGVLSVRGRIKEVLILSAGEKLSPDEVEGSIRRDPLFEQIMVVGDGRPQLAALAVLADEPWTELARGLGLDPASPDSLRAPPAQQAVLARIRARLTDFPKYAQVRNMLALREPWTIESGLLTPTLKLRRHAIAERYASEIDALYRR